MKKMKIVFTCSFIIFFIFVTLNYILTGIFENIIFYVVLFSAIFLLETFFSGLKHEKHKKNECKRSDYIKSYLIDAFVNFVLWVIVFILFQGQKTFFKPILMITIIYILNVNFYYPSPGNLIGRIRVVANDNMWKIFFSNVCYFFIYSLCIGLIVINPFLAIVFGLFYSIDFIFKLVHKKNIIYYLMKINIYKIV